MKREIKFRAWHRTAKEMLYEKAFMVLGWEEVEHQPLDVMQFTGLKDRNGMEIYEGDIINDNGLIMTIEFFKASFCKCNENGNWILHSHDKYEVIGNVYENAELTDKV
jgi:hypothetical protein